jgi:hypothetical protein
MSRSLPGCRTDHGKQRQHRPTSACEREDAEAEKRESRLKKRAPFFGVSHRAADFAGSEVVAGHRDSRTTIMRARQFDPTDRPS